jgi:hypothetical protein
MPDQIVKYINANRIRISGKDVPPRWFTRWGCTYKRDSWVRWTQGVWEAEYAYVGLEDSQEVFHAKLIDKPEQEEFVMPTMVGSMGVTTPYSLYDPRRQIDLSNNPFLQTQCYTP